MSQQALFLITPEVAVRAACWGFLMVALVFNLGCSKTVPPSRLQPSGASGLHGVPLPMGFKLIEQRTGNRKAGQGAGERYSISASETDILRFFEQEMTAAGWSRLEGDDTRSTRAFRKDGREVVVMTDFDGGTFTLMEQ
jgi:hypothetical protein